MCCSMSSVRLPHDRPVQNMKPISQDGMICAGCRNAPMPPATRPATAITIPCRCKRSMPAVSVVVSALVAIVI